MQGSAQSVAEIEAIRALAYEFLRREPNARDAHLRLYEVEQMLGRPQAAVAHLRMALRDSRVVTTPAKSTPAEFTILAISRIAPWEANVPLELVIDEERTTLHRFYLADDDPESILEAALPHHTITFNAIAESDRARPALDLAKRLQARGRETFVNRPDAVAALSRDRVSSTFAASSTVIAPRVERATAATLRADGVRAPAVIRPVGSQAGIDFARVEDAAAVRAYLEARADDLYYVMPFADYRNADGFYRKYRVMFVDGVPYPCHLAISPRWKVHYYDAPMAEHAWMRDEEARFIADLPAVFCGAAGEALREIASAFPLEYFGIDCSLTADGRLLLFEADTAMLVHGSDSPELYPYKRAAFENVQTALSALFRRLAIPPGPNRR